MITTEAEEYKELFESIFDETLKLLRQPVTLEAGVEILSEDEICVLNSTMRDIDAPTDVLSFPSLNIKAGDIIDLAKYKNDTDFESGLLYLGDIAICGGIAKSQAAEYGHSLHRETAYLFLHGLLHLFGYDHIDAGDKKLMREKEETILSSLAIARD